MDKAVLVNLELENGARIIEALDESGLKVGVALWATLSEYGGGRLILASRHFDDGSPLKAYGRVLEAPQEKGVHTSQVPPLLVLRMKEPIYRGSSPALRKDEISNGNAPWWPVLR